MRFPLPYLVIALLTGLLLWEGRAADEYRDAKPERPVFDNSELGLMAIEQEKLATELAAYVRNELGRGDPSGGDASERMNFANRMIGVALQLHPRNRTALIANFKLTRGVETEYATSDYEPDVLAECLYTRSKLLIEQGGEANDQLASYLLSFAVEIDPTNEDAIYDLEVRRTGGKGPDWGMILPWMKVERRTGPEVASGEGAKTTESENPPSEPAKPTGKEPVPPPRFGGWPLDDGKRGMGPLISD